MMRRVLAIGACLAGVAAHAEPLPQPLSLDYALSLAETMHPDVLAQQAELALARAKREQAESRLGFDARAVADGRWVEPSTRAGGDVAGDSRFTSHNDSRFHLILSRRLYDFGQSRAEIAAAGALQDVEARRLDALKRRRRLQIMRDYFEVLLADLAFAQADEAMAIEFVRLERIQDRNRLGQRSDVRLADQERRYQQRRLERYRAQARQRTRRARLAETLNRPGELPAELLEPALAGLDRQAPDPELWIDQAMASNPDLLALRAEAEAAREQLRAARYANRPVVSGELRASRYAREFSSRDKYRAGLQLDIPLYTGGRVDAQRAGARARLQGIEARLARARSEIRQALVEAWERIGVLGAQRDQAASELDFRDLDLDRARTLYDMEASADLGDTMAQFSAARLRRAEAEYQLALTWAEVALLTGHPAWDPLASAINGEGENSTTKAHQGKADFFTPAPGAR